MSDVIIVGIIAAAGGLLTTILGWFLNQQGVSRRSKEFEALKSRIDIIDRLNESKPSTSELTNEIEKLRIREARAVMAELKSLSEVERADTAPNKTSISMWKRAILGYEQISLKGRVLHIADLEATHRTLMEIAMRADNLLSQRA